MKKEYYSKNKNKYFESRFKPRQVYEKNNDYRNKADFINKYESENKHSVTHVRKFSNQSNSNLNSGPNSVSPICLNIKSPVDSNNSDYIKKFGNFICNFFLNNPNTNSKNDGVNFPHTWENGNNLLQNINTTKETHQFLSKKSLGYYNSNPKRGESNFTILGEEKFNKDFNINSGYLNLNSPFSNDIVNNYNLTNTTTFSIGLPSQEFKKTDVSYCEDKNDILDNLHCSNGLKLLNAKEEFDEDLIVIINSYLLKINSSQDEGFEKKFDYRFDPNLFSFLTKDINISKVMKGQFFREEIKKLKALYSSMFKQNNNIKINPYVAFSFKNHPKIYYAKEDLFSLKKLNSENKLQECKKHIESLNKEKELSKKKMSHSMERINMIKTCITLLKIKNHQLDLTLKERLETNQIN